MSTPIPAESVRAAASALARVDGVDYFEVDNLAGIADYEAAAGEILSEAVAHAAGLPFSRVIERVGAVEAAARVMARQEGSRAFRVPNSPEADNCRAAVRTILAETFPAVQSLAAA